MAEKNNATCSICGSPYYLCMSCRDSMMAHPWKMHTDTAEHYKVYQIIHGLSTNVYSKDEVRAKLKNVDISDVESYRPHIKKIIKDILKEEIVAKPTVKVVEKVKQTVTEVATVEENMVVEDITEVEKTEDVVKATYSRKRNYKVDAE